MPKTYRHHHEAEKQAVAESLGYESIEEAYLKLYEEKGLSMAQIAQVFDVTYQAIRFRLYNLGAKIRPRGGYWRDRKSVEELLGEKRLSGGGVVK